MLMALLIYSLSFRRTSFLGHKIKKNDRKGIKTVLCTQLATD